MVASRALAAPIADGLAKAVSGPLARAAAPALVFAGALALFGLLGAALLRATGLSRAVQAPADRALGAVLSGAKALVVVWVLLSALSVAGDALPWLGERAARSEFAALAREHNLLLEVLPEQVEALEGLGKKL